MAEAINPAGATPAAAPAGGAAAPGGGFSLDGVLQQQQAMMYQGINIQMAQSQLSLEAGAISNGIKAGVDFISTGIKASKEVSGKVTQ